MILPVKFAAAYHGSCRNWGNGREGRIEAYDTRRLHLQKRTQASYTTNFRKRYIKLTVSKRKAAEPPNSAASFSHLSMQGRSHMFSPTGEARADALNIRLVGRPYIIGSHSDANESRETENPAAYNHAVRVGLRSYQANQRRILIKATVLSSPNWRHCLLRTSWPSDNTPNQRPDVSPNRFFALVCEGRAHVPSRTSAGHSLAPRVSRR
jgi:hypothetical protein